jgi:hypothetical protein
MARWVLVATAFVLAFGSNHANAAKTLLTDLMARLPAGSGEPAMSALALEACMRRAQELDRTGTAIDYEIAAIDREAAEGVLLQNQINAELPILGGYDESALNAFQRRVIRHEELAKKFQGEFPLYQQKQKAYDAAVAEFEYNCATRFRPGDLEAIKSKLDLK